MSEPLGLTPGEWQALHPRLENGPLYHCARHSSNVGWLMGFLAARYFPGKEDFLRDVGFLHDIDPGRTPGTPPRVPATLDWMRRIRDGLQRRLSWSDADFATARVLIMRTEYPLDASWRAYGRSLAALPAGRRAFALSAGAVLSEYADKASWYLGGHDVARAAVRGLTGELGAAGGSTGGHGGGTRRFLSRIGLPESFARDRRLAAELGLADPRLPLIDEVLARLGVQPRRNFKENVARFGGVRRAGPAAARGGRPR